MVNYFAHVQVYDLIIFQTIILIIALSNIWVTHRIRHHSPPQIFPTVSILLPVRNEERNIAKCVESLLEQDYPSFEILVLDDQSSDGTRSILERIAVSKPRLRILDGIPPSSDQVGKNWACSQLAQRAQGELILFTDADTRHHKNTLRTIVTALMGENADLLTGFPHQEVRTWGEYLLVPFFSWILLSFIPLVLGYKIQRPALSSAVGQLMLFKRDAYFAIGGHASVSSSIVEDMSLAGRIMAAKFRWRVSYVADLISCRMYQSSWEAVDGFTKNLFAVFEYRLLPFLFAYIWLVVMFWKPLIILGLMISGQSLQAQPVSLAVCLILSLLLWLIHYIEMDFPFGLAFLYPFTVLANVGVAFRSLVYSLGGRVTWKGRPIARTHWKWL